MMMAGDQCQGVACVCVEGNSSDRTISRLSSGLDFPAAVRRGPRGVAHERIVLGSASLPRVFSKMWRRRPRTEVA
jgi:hypothetical protein